MAILNIMSLIICIGNALCIGLLFSNKNIPNRTSLIVFNFVTMISNAFFIIVTMSRITS